jgi:hypothetical protein
MSSLDDAVSIKFQNGYFWNTIPTGIRFGNPEDRLEFMLDPTSYLILTTSSAFNFVPKSKSVDFFYNIFNKYRIPYQVEGGMFVVDCSVTMPDVRFLLQGYWVALHGADLLIDISEKGDRSLCVCSFVPSQDEIWVLGQGLYKDYYMIHDPDNIEITFVPTEKQLKEPLEAGLQPLVKFQKGYNWVFLAIKAASMIVMGFATWGMVELIRANSGLTFLEAGAKPTSKSVFKTSKPATIHAETITALIAKLEALN